MITNFIHEEKRKEIENDANNNPATNSNSAALNTFLSRLEETNAAHLMYWNSVYDLVQNGDLVKISIQYHPEICEEWETNYFKLLSIQIEGTDFFVPEERSKLVKNLQNFTKTLGPCINSLSKDRIFQLLMSSEKADLALMIEWDNENSYYKKNNSYPEIQKEFMI